MPKPTTGSRLFRTTLFPIEEDRLICVDIVKLVIRQKSTLDGMFQST